MPRPREFDYDEVIDRSMNLFWQQGYHATSIQDVVSETGVNRGSLYSVFGSKQGLFATALRRYVERDGIGRVITDEAGRPVGQVLDDMFALVVEAGSAPNGAGRRGCFLTNTVVELGNSDAEPSAEVSALIKAVEEVLTDRLRQARGRGEVSDDKDPRALARFLIATIQGMRVLAKLDPGRRTLREIAEQARAHVLSGARAD